MLSSSTTTARFFLLLISLSSILILILFNGTGLEADSFHHHLIAKYAPLHPELFLDHWGKPLYTLFSSAFAQFGFIGSKVLNVILSLLNAFLCYKILREMKVDQSPWVILIFFLIPLNFQVNFSSFTEPLFATLLLLSIFQSFKENYSTAAIIISFAPMVRSEGLIILMVFSLYLLLKKQYRSLPLLLGGQLLYSLIGFIFFNHSFLWLFTEIPYASLESPYGKGSLFHFSEQLFYMLGPVWLGLFILGLILHLNKSRLWDYNWSILILGSFLAFFLFHSISWHFGWFNSMGLKRVFGAVSPLMAIISTLGLNKATQITRNKRVKIISSVLITLLATALLFSKGPAGIDWKNEMNLSIPQQVANKIGRFIKESKLSYEKISFADRYLANELQIDIYDEDHFLLLEKDNLSQLRSGDIIIWENWHAPTDFNLKRELLDQNDDLELLKAISDHSTNRNVEYVIYRHR